MAFQQWERNIPLLILVGMNRSTFTNIRRNRIVSDICCSIPSTHIRALHAINPPSPPDFWEMTLGHLSGLRYVTLSDGYMPDLVSLLALPGDEPKGHVTSDRDLT